VVYGRVPTGDVALALADSYEAGRLDLDHLRGISWQEPPVQAAVHEVRRRAGLTGLTDVVPFDSIIAAPASSSEGEWRVELAVGDARWEAWVQLVPTGVLRPISCGTDETEDPGRWEVAAVAQV
jgi:hypothetical protein